MLRWQTTKTCTRWRKHHAPALAGAIQGFGEVNRLSMGRVVCLAAQDRRSKREVKSVRAGTLPCGTNRVPARLDTPLPPGLSPDSCPVLRTLQQGLEPGQPLPCDCLHGVGPAVHSYSAIDAGTHRMGCLRAASACCAGSFWSGTQFDAGGQAISNDGDSPTGHLLCLEPSTPRPIWPATLRWGIHPC